jgi:hypothetical protein
MEQDPFTPAYITQVEEDTFGGTKTYFRDANISVETYLQYKNGLVIQETGFFDTSELEGGLTALVRYNIYTNQTNELTESFRQYRCWTFPRGCYFKVLHRFNQKNHGLVTLLQIPVHAVAYFALNTHPREAEIAEDSIQRFQSMMAQPPNPALNDEYWLKRTAFPLGISNGGGLFFEFDYGKQQNLNPNYERKGFFKRLFKK